MRRLTELIAILFIISGCGIFDADTDMYATELSSQNSTEDTSYVAESSVGASGVPDDDLKYIAYLRSALENKALELPEFLVNLLDFSVCEMSITAVQPFHIMENLTSKGVLVRCHSESRYDVWFLIIDNDGIYECLYVGNIPASTPPEIYYEDIDGDGWDEIITHTGVSVSGRTGPYYETNIFKWANAQLTTLYCSTNIEHPEQLINTGFEVVFSDNDKGTMRNTYTHLATEFDTSSFGFYDEDGKFNLPSRYIEAEKSYTNAKGRADHFLTFEPIDIDNDGIYEIICSEAFFIDIQGSYGIGWFFQL